MNRVSVGTVSIHQVGFVVRILHICLLWGGDVLRTSGFITGHAQHGPEASFGAKLCVDDDDVGSGWLHFHE